jgi:hypothetical protein
MTNKIKKILFSMKIFNKSTKELNNNKTPSIMKKALKKLPANI